MSWRFHNPVEIVAGPGCLSELETLVSAQKILFLSSFGFTAKGLTGRVVKLLSACQLEIHDRVTPNPDLDGLDKLIREYRFFNPELILAMGGGSVMDTAKVLSLFLNQGGDYPLNDHFRQGTPIRNVSAIGLLLVPTTSGTGAEVTPFATVWDDRHKKKYSLDHPAAFARTALLDSELTLGLSRQNTLYTGLDALSHALESLWNRHAGPVSRLYAQSALQRIVHSLPRVLENGDDLECRTSMQEAALFAGMAISSTRTAIAHAISYPLTLHFAVPHGLAAAFTLSAILRLCTRKQLKIQLDPDLLSKILAMLDSFGLGKIMRQYARAEQVMALREEMGNPARSRNFSLDLDQDCLVRLLEESLRS